MADMDFDELVEATGKHVSSPTADPRIKAFFKNYLQPILEELDARLLAVEEASEGDVDPELATQALEYLSMTATFMSKLLKHAGWADAEGVPTEAFPEDLRGDYQQLAAANVPLVQALLEAADDGTQPDPDEGQPEPEAVGETA